MKSNNYFNLGKPKVTFLSETPAKWKVFRVSWVVGYAILWAAIAPIAYPTGAIDILNFFNILFAISFI